MWWIVLGFVVWWAFGAAGYLVRRHDCEKTTGKWTCGDRSSAIFSAIIGGPLSFVVVVFVWVTEGDDWSKSAKW